MASPAINVIRYTALVGGIGYGIFHQRTLQAKKNHHDAAAAKHHREHLIEEAKKQWKLKQEAKKDGVVTNPDDPRFDLEKLIVNLENQQ